MSTRPHVKRPTLIWLISAFCILSHGYILVSFFLVQAGLATLNDAQQAHFDSLSTLDYALSLGVAAAWLAGGITLFLLKRSALSFFGIALALNIVAVAWHFSRADRSEMMSGSQLVGVAIGAGLVLAVFLYTWWLHERKILH